MWGVQGQDPSVITNQSSGKMLLERWSCGMMGNKYVLEFSRPASRRRPTQHDYDSSIRLKERQRTPSEFEMFFFGQQAGRTVVVHIIRYF